MSTLFGAKVCQKCRNFDKSMTYFVAKMSTFYCQKCPRVKFTNSRLLSCLPRIMAAHTLPLVQLLLKYSPLELDKGQFDISLFINNFIITLKLCSICLLVYEAEIIDSYPLGDRGTRVGDSRSLSSSVHSSCFFHQQLQELLLVEEM